MDFSTIPSLMPTNQLDELVKKYIELESRPIKDLENARQDIEVRQGMMRDLNAMILSLKDKCATLTGDDVVRLLNTRQVTSSRPEIITGSADGTALNAVYSIFVERLAKADTVLSNRLDASGTTIQTSPGDKTFTITINGVSKDITVSVSSGETDEAVLSKMAQAINNAAAEDPKLGVSAAVVRETPDTVRLVLTSQKTGRQQAIDLSESEGNNLLALTGTNSEIQSSDTTGGFLIARDQLDSKFNINGLTFIRQSNTVSDAITGVTLNLAAAQAATDAPVQVEVKRDVSTIVSTIQKWLDSYNKTLKYIQDKTLIDADLGIRGPLAGDYLYVGLKANMRTILQAQVTGLDPTTGPVSLAQIGITADNSGALSISDRSKLESIISQDPNRVSEILGGANGSITKLQALISPFVDNLTGIIPRQQQALDDRMERIKDRIRSLQEQMDQRELVLRREFSSILQAMVMLNAQRSTLNSIWGIS